MTDQPLTRSEIAGILSRHRGAKADLSRRAGVAHNAVSMWLSGGANANVARHADQMARELLAQEEVERLAHGEANGKSVRSLIEQLRAKATGTE